MEDTSLGWRRGGCRVSLAICMRSPELEDEAAILLQWVLRSKRHVPPRRPSPALLQGIFSSSVCFDVQKFLTRSPIHLFFS